MARTTKAAGRPALAARGTRGRPASPASAKPAAKLGAKTGAKTARASVAAPKPSKEDLRLQVEKLERSLSTARARNRALVQASRKADERITELEMEVERLEKAAARAPAREAAPRRPRRQRGIDPGDAVPPGVAVEEPAPLDEEAEAARESLEENLSGE